MAAEDDRERALRAAAAPAEERTVHLAGGRSLAVSDEAVELRSPSGQLELRIKLTAEGPVLQVEGARVELRAAESVAVDCKRFEVRAAEGVTLRTEGTVDVEAKDDVTIVGKLIHLN